MIVRYLLRRAETRFKRFRLAPAVYRLTSRLVYKKSNVITASAEAEAMLFVAAPTSIPVPRLRFYWVEGDEGCLIMDYVEGEMLQRVWGNLTDAQRLNVMRPPCRLRLPPTGWIGSALGHAFMDFSMAGMDIPIGPFANERDFYDCRLSRYSVYSDIHPSIANRIENVRRRMPDDHPIVFTHGDINGRNVLVRVHGNGPDDVEITALLDWEQAGWRPVYWESRKWLVMAMSRLGWREFGKREIAGEYAREVDIDYELEEISVIAP
ncbi:hypothetical protein BN946_scf184969.g26 [Trametes cinnabarina]|uniref:Aminoglycoside phosphotransferase domain-containing protein n=1 Tax=Pycnoporus cinnabarinus TaxID=5643 RepID=A0A060STE8_PYCCI|nr:hypothetical protein BN946_scf184969.g26 [Trametes cinnabarina]